MGEYNKITKREIFAWTLAGLALCLSVFHLESNFVPVICVAVIIILLSVLVSESKNKLKFWITGFLITVCIIGAVILAFMSSFFPFMSAGKIIDKYTWKKYYIIQIDGSREIELVCDKDMWDSVEISDTEYEFSYDVCGFSTGIGIFKSMEVK